MNRTRLIWGIVLLVCGLGLLYRTATTGMGTRYVRGVPVASKSSERTWTKYEDAAPKERGEAGGGRGPAAGCGDDEQNNQVKTVHFQDGGGRKHGGNWKRI